MALAVERIVSLLERIAGDSLEVFGGFFGILWSRIGIFCIFAIFFRIFLLGFARFRRDAH